MLKDRAPIPSPNKPPIKLIFRFGKFARIWGQNVRVISKFLPANVF